MQLHTTGYSPQTFVWKNHKSMSHLDSAETEPANVPVLFPFSVGQTCSKDTLPPCSHPSNWSKLLMGTHLPGFGSGISAPELRTGKGEAFMQPGVPPVTKGKQSKDRDVWCHSR